MQKISQAFAWSFRSLAVGRNPTSRHDGSPFSVDDLVVRATPGGVIPHAALLQIRGDWEGLVCCFRLRAPNQDNFCWACDASLSPGLLNFTDFSRDAPHRNTCLCHIDYLERCAAEGQQPSNLFRCPGTQLKHLIVDSMHAADLGTFADAVGSLFYMEISNKAWYPMQAQGLVALNVAMNAYYARNKDKNLTRATPVSLTQILGKDPKYPFMKAKAAPVRHLAEFCLELAYKHLYGVEGGRPPFAFTARSPMHGKTAQHLELMVNVFRGMERYCRSLHSTPFDATMCTDSMLLYLSSLAALNKLWRIGRDPTEASRLPWQVRPKCHLMQHLVLDHMKNYGNPSLFWCYRDEDFVGAVKRLCAKTKNPATLESRVLLKLVILAALSVYL